MVRSRIQWICSAFLLIAGPGLSRADTTVSGPIKTEMKWSGTVTVTGDVTIVNGGKVIIAPGTRVLAVANSDDQLSGSNVNRVEITLEGGILEAIGTESNPIYFTSNSDKPKYGDWYGIIAKSGMVNISYNFFEYASTGFDNRLSGLSFDHCNFQKNDIGLIAGPQTVLSETIIDSNFSIGIKITSNAQLILNKSKVIKSTFGILTESGSKVVLKKSQVSENNSGIYGSGDVELYGTSVINNQGIGIEANRIIANNSIISDNGGQGISAKGAFSTFDHCNIEGNSNASAYTGGINVNSDSIIENSIITGNGYNALTLGQFSVRSIVKNNIIDNNNGYGIMLYNIFDVDINNNSIQRNQQGIFLQYEILTSTDIGELMINSNNINDNASYDVYYNFGSGAVLFSKENYWGGPTTTELQQHAINLTKIFDSRDDPNKGQIVIRAYSSNPFAVPGHPGVLTLGDLNMDGTIDVTDAVTSLQILVGLINPEEYQLIAGDLNYDSQVTVEDSVAILQKIVGIGSA